FAGHTHAQVTADSVVHPAARAGRLRGRAEDLWRGAARSLGRADLRGRGRHRRLRRQGQPFQRPHHRGLPEGRLLDDARGRRPGRAGDDARPRLRDPEGRQRPGRGVRRAVGQAAVEGSGRAPGRGRQRHPAARARDPYRRYRRTHRRLLSFRTRELGCAFMGGGAPHRRRVPMWLRTLPALSPVLLVSAATSPAFAQDSAAPIRAVAPVVVSGALPGPGLWKVSKGDHVMWVLGTQAPLPRRMHWQSERVEEILAASQELIRQPVMGFSVEAGGFLRSVFLLPRVYGARKNPDGAHLRDVLSEPLYARWMPLRERYLGSGRKAERMRPVFAAGELWEEALEDNDLVQGGIVEPVLERAVKRYGLRQTHPKWVLKVTDAKALLAEAEHARL